MIETDGDFYLGRHVDAESGQTNERPLLYDPDDLTTHAVIVGMTGSGKTGLCLDLMEEAALTGVPALMIDPKGDITNALLHFPDLAPSDFAPWINPDEASREDQTVAEAAEDKANLWRNGLAGWDIGPDRIKKLKESAQFAIYTPGSDAGIPISIVSSLGAPDIPWEGNREILHERISGTVTALLGLIGLTDIDPVRSREHILLSNIFEDAWRQGRDLTLGELIMQTQNPPFEKLGVFDVNTFFPEKDRFDLAIQLNSMLASPAFQIWLEGQPLDIPSLLYMPDGRPRHTVFYIAHLNDAERMFFVTLLYGAVETWMRAQSGSTSLRALVYFDEIFGYLPPIGNPPSKEPMLRLLKQARAFGVGMVLASQNPVDIDYKALSNAGTWFIGKLGTDQDKQRLLDGLESAMTGGLDRRTYDRLISALGKRVFLLRNVHEKQPVLFQTRWAMNYLAGPITRNRIDELNELAGATATTTPSTTPDSPASAAASATVVPVPDPAGDLSDLGSVTKPAVPGRTEEYFFPHTLTLSQAAKADGRDLPADATPLGLLYRPTLLAQAHVRVNQRKYDLDYETTRTAVVLEPDRRGQVRWDGHLATPIAARDLDRRAARDARFASLEAPLSDARTLSALKKDFQDWAYRETSVTVRANEKLKLYAGPDIDDEAFAERLTEAAQDAAENEIDKLEATFKRKLDALQKKLTREERELEEDRAEYRQRKLEEGAKHVETLFGLFSKRRRSLSSSLTKRRMTARAKEDVEESEAAIKEMQTDMTELQEEMREGLTEIRDKWAAIAAEREEITVNPYKKDVDVALFGVAWLPYHVVESDGRRHELPGYPVGEAG